MTRVQWIYNNYLDYDTLIPWFTRSYLTALDKMPTLSSESIISSPHTMLDHSFESSVLNRLEYTILKNGQINDNYAEEII